MTLGFCGISFGESKKSANDRSLPDALATACAVVYFQLDKLFVESHLNFEPSGSTLYQGIPVGGFDTMKKLITKVQKFMQAEDGPTAVEYAIMLALIVIVCIAAVGQIGAATNTAFEAVANELNGLPTGGGGGTP